MRHLRRDLVSLYTANVLAWQTGPTALWYLQGVPRANALRALVARALDHFLPGIVNHMKQQLYCYSGTVLRCDGNWESLRLREMRMERSCAGSARIPSCMGYAS